MSSIIIGKILFYIFGMACYSLFCGKKKLSENLSAEMKLQKNRHQVVVESHGHSGPLVINLQTVQLALRSVVALEKSNPALLNPNHFVATQVESTWGRFFKIRSDGNLRVKL
jgi:hypothetical protein